jgi:hypothetical protein
MSLLVVGLLAILWASILLPGALRNRRESSPQTTIDSFERSMSMLAMRAKNRPASGRQVLVLPPPPQRPPSPRVRAVRRRRQILARLAVATTASALLALIIGGAFWALFGVVAAALGSYVASLVYLQTRQAETQRKVRRIPLTAPTGARVTFEELYAGERAHGG